MAVMGDQLLALAGVVVGAGMSYLVGGLNERARSRRERAARLDEHRLAHYAAYGRAVKAMYGLAARIAAARGLNTQMRPIDPESGLPELDRLAVERELEWEHVLLLGDPAVVAAARAWHQSIWHLEWFARARIPDPTPESWTDAVIQSGLARDRYYESARRDVGHSSGPLPEAPWPPAWMPKAGP